MKKNLSAFTVFSFGGEGGSSKAGNVLENPALELEDLKQRIIVIIGKMDELYARPRMPYTQGHSENQILELAEDGNIEPDWVSLRQPGHSGSVGVVRGSWYGGARGHFGRRRWSNLCFTGAEREQKKLCCLDHDCSSLAWHFRRVCLAERSELPEPAIITL